MQMGKFKKSDQFFVETKLGIVTQTGDWFHTTTEHIESFAPGLLDQVPLETLIKEAQAWVRSAGSLSLILLYGLLFWINPWIAAGIVLVFHWFWYHKKSALVIRSAGKLLRFVNSNGLLFIVAFFSLSVLGFQQEYVATGIGIFFFFVMKPGLLRKVWDKLAQSLSSDGLTLNDRVLKMVIIKHAMYEDTAPSKVREMEERFKDLAMNRKKGKG
jgi:hypothetical protein